MAFLYGLMSNKRFCWAICGLVLVLLWIILWSPPAPPVKQVKKEVQGTKEKLYDLRVGSWQNRVDQDLEVTKKQIAEVDRAQQEIKEQLKSIGDALGTLTRQNKETKLMVGKAAPPMFEQQGVGGGIMALRFGESRTSERPNEVKPIPNPRVRPTTYLPGGSMARSILLTGVDAPVRGKPFPVLIALTEAFTAPNSYRVPLRGCFALGKAEGNASSERADIQVVRMSCVLPGGKVFEQEVTGYLVADDGKQGIPGKLVEKQGQKIAMAALAGVGSGLARAFGQQEVTNIVTDSGAITSTVTGNALRFGLSKGAEGAATELRHYFEKQAERLVPVVEVEAGKKVTLIMIFGVKVPGLVETVARSGVRKGID